MANKYKLIDLKKKLDYSNIIPTMKALDLKYSAWKFIAFTESYNGNTMALYLTNEVDTGTSESQLMKVSEGFFAGKEEDKDNDNNIISIDDVVPIEEGTKGITDVAKKVAPKILEIVKSLNGEMGGFPDSDKKKLETAANSLYKTYLKFLRMYDEDLAAKLSESKETDNDDITNED